MQSGAYIICATPRSGSTLLCDMLAGSGVAGNPNSYYRPPSIAHFAAQMGVPYDAARRNSIAPTSPPSSRPAGVTRTSSA